MPFCFCFHLKTATAQVLSAEIFEILDLKTFWSWPKMAVAKTGELCTGIQIIV